MTDVRNVFITKEVADILKINPSYLLRLAKSMEFSPNEMREAGKRNYLFSKEAVEKLKSRNEK
ncbi:MAG: helix-turn-helix domain-containing protein [Clostridiaceae bacterium]|nr:helix-turn-helix domain-containing protein [Clostridiaceae bacterium]